MPIIRYATRVHCVVDGAPPKNTKEERKEKRKKREEAKRTIHEIEKTEQMSENREVDKHLKKQKEKLSYQAWYPTREYVEYVKKWLIGEGCVIHQAAVDADSGLIELEKTGWIDLIISNDSDLLTLGANHVVRIYSPEDAGIYDRTELGRVLDLCPVQWMDFMNLCRTMKQKDIMMAYSFIRVYKEFDYAFERYDALYSTLQKESIEDINCTETFFQKERIEQ